MTLSGDKSKVFAALARMPKVSIEGMTHHMPDTATGRKHAAMQLGTWLDDLASPHCDRADVREAVKAMPSRSRA